jgi:hypothetical protein
MAISFLFHGVEFGAGRVLNARAEFVFVVPVHRRATLAVTNLPLYCDNRHSCWCLEVSYGFTQTISGFFRTLYEPGSTRIKSARSGDNISLHLYGSARD